VKEVESAHPAGTIGYPSSGAPRFLQFYDALERTVVPRGTKLVRAASCHVVENCNQLLTNTVGDWCWFQGDDHAWSPTLLMQLLDHRVDAVVPIIPRWGPPFLPVVYKEFDPARHHAVTYTWMELQLLRDRGERLVPIVAAGSGGLLVKRQAWEALREADGDPIFRNGALGQSALSEDLDFTYRLNRLGHTLYMDLGAFMGHCTTVVIEPRETTSGHLAVVANIHGSLTSLYATRQHPTAEVG
jgi:hypothetical protein